MRNFKLTIQYLGTNYSGWQIQPNGLTIQELLQRALAKIFQQKIHVMGAGRTDAGVHALAQGAHFAVDTLLELQKLRYAINSQLPDDVAVINVEEVPPEFHALNDAKSKVYTYFIYNSDQRLPWLTPYTWRCNGFLDIDEMQLCLDAIVGEHDFSSFRAADSAAKTSQRHLEFARLTRLTMRDFGSSLSGIFGLSAMLKPGGTDDFHVENDDAILAISLKGRGFLKHMVRNIVGTLVDVGRGKTSFHDFENILASRDRRQAGITAPPQGLFLVRVEY